jgi:hypothetical protein
MVYKLSAGIQRPYCCNPAKLMSSIRVTVDRDPLGREFLLQCVCASETKQLRHNEWRMTDLHLAYDPQVVSALQNDTEHKVPASTNSEA